MDFSTVISRLMLAATSTAIVWGGGGFMFMKVAINDLPTRNKPSFFITHQDRIDTGKYLSLRHLNISICSRADSAILSGTLFYCPSGSVKTIIFCHGVTDNRWFMMRGNRVDGYLDRGYNVLVYDQRAHGKSGGQICTLGHLEQHDLDQWVDTVFRLFPRGQVGVEGVSMGAATAILHAGYINPLRPKNWQVKFYVFDCPFSDLAQQLAYGLKVRYRLPDYGFTLALNEWNKHLNGFDIYDVSPIKAAKFITVPVLFIHGTDDEYVPVYMSKDLYQVVPSKKMIYLVPTIKHGDAVYRGKPFWVMHDQFINNIVNNPTDGRNKHREDGAERSLVKGAMGSCSLGKTPIFTHNWPLFYHCHRYRF